MLSFHFRQQAISEASVSPRVVVIDAIREEQRVRDKAKDMCLRDFAFKNNFMTSMEFPDSFFIFIDIDITEHYLMCFGK